MENSELITKAIRYINNEKKNSGMSIEDVAVNAGFSTNYFNRIFFEHTGFNVMEYIRFTRLKAAAISLRTSERSVIDIALDCGYETHESFTRAFKKQYEMTPSEYRKKYEKAECWYGEFNNDTIAARLTHEFKQLKVADPDEIREYLLEKDALKWGYMAVTTKVNGGAGFYIGDDFRRGFVWFYEIDDKIWGDVICEDLALVAEYLKLFSDDRFEMCFFSLDDVDAVTSALLEYGIKVFESDCYDECVYTGKPYDLIAPEGITMRELHYDDFEMIRSYLVGKGSDLPKIEFYKRELYKRDVLKSDEMTVLIFGIFSEDRLIGLSYGGLQYANGFKLNNCIYTDFADEEYKDDALYRFAFKFVTKAVLEKGALPFDDVQTPCYKPEDKYGSFNSVDLGYKLVNRSYHPKYEIV
ncbi:MAG: helix-turn-helix transcriptional regulator [Clostridia bacterium]|nr:helix-turn-helix transcriptional regulator [Clostridia bacterium]